MTKNWVRSKRPRAASGSPARSVKAILRLEARVGAKRLEAACSGALYFGDIRYRRIKEILNAPVDRDPQPADNPSIVPSEQAATLEKW